MADWSPPQRPASYAEESLVTAILEGVYPPGSTLPGERGLAAELGVTRPTLRETLQRLSCEGWLTIQQGKSTRVNNFWQEGGLNVLGALVRYGERVPPEFVPNLLEVRLALAPAYVAAAVQRSPELVVDYVANYTGLEDSPEAFARFDWALHRSLTIASKNPIYTLILNGFAGFYEDMACLYFAQGQARDSSRAFYASLLEVARAVDVIGAERITRSVMEESIVLWRQGGA
jgi:GntR family negative regulator for fad regulon and positive regulator of fabA